MQENGRDILLFIEDSSTPPVHPLSAVAGDNRRAVALLGTVAAESGMTAAVNDRFGSVLRKIYAVGFVLFAVQYAVLAAVGGIDPQAAVGQVGVVVIVDVNAERNADGQQNSQQAEKSSAEKRFFLLVLYRTPLFYKHFPQSLQPLQINLLPQVSQFARKCGTYKSSCGMG